MSEIIEDEEIKRQPLLPYSLLDYSVRTAVFNSYATTLVDSNGIKVLTKCPLDQFYQLATEINILHHGQLSLKSKLLKNQKPFIISSTELQKILYRSFLKCSYDSEFKILVNEEGELTLRLNSFFTSAAEVSHRREMALFCVFIEKTYQEAIQIFSKAFPKILPLIQPYFQKNLSLSVEIQQRIDILKSNCGFVSVSPNQSHPISQNFPSQYATEEELQLTKFYDRKTEYSKTKGLQKFAFFDGLWNPQSKRRKQTETMLPYDKFNPTRMKEIFKSSNKMIESKTKKGQVGTEQIYSEIHLENIDQINWNKFHQGGFGVLSYAQVRYFHVEPENALKPPNTPKRFTHKTSLSKLVVMKADKSHCSRPSRITVQKQILKKLRGKKNKFIPQFYYSEQKIKQCDDYLMMDFYPLKSLDSWIKSFGDFGSLFTKVSMLLFVCYGVSFLHENNIIHRDLKLANILVQNKLCIKIIDYGESYHPEAFQQLKKKNINLRPGFTMPYTPPEAFSKDKSQSPTQAYDVFSLGTIMFELLFGKNLFADMSVAAQKELFTLEAKRLYEENGQHEGRYYGVIQSKLMLASESLSDFGPMQLMAPLLNLICRCLQSSPKNRPHLPWIIVILKEIYTIMLEYYFL